MIEPEDAARELDKAADALGDAHDYLLKMSYMNAALHLAKEVRPTPLAARVATALDEARRSAERFRRVEV
jgi:hypothetical protein